MPRDLEFQYTQFGRYWLHGKSELSSRHAKEMPDTHGLQYFRTNCALDCASNSWQVFSSFFFSSGWVGGPIHCTQPISLHVWNFSPRIFGHRQIFEMMTEPILLFSPVSTVLVTILPRNQPENVGSSGFPAWGVHNLLPPSLCPVTVLILCVIIRVAM